MRIRTIKPEFWRSQDVSRLDIETRLLFIGLWSYVDDNGVGADRESVIAADLFADDMARDPRETLATIQRGLATLSEAGMITRYTVDNRDYLYISNWERHQRIDKPNKPRLPLPTSENAEIATHSRDSRETLAPGTGEQGNRGTGLYTFKSAADASNVEHDEQTPNGDQSDQKKSKKNAYPVDFEKFWQVYPRRQSKGDALKAWKQAKKQADVETIMAGAQRYADDPNRTDQYTQLAGTWLRAHGWENEPLPERHQPKTFAQQTTDNNNQALLRAVQGGGDLWSTPEEQETLRSGGRWQLGS